MLLADVAVAALLELPLHTGVLLEEIIFSLNIIFNPLIEYQLRIVHNSGNDELVSFVIIQPTKTLRHLRSVNGFQVVHDFLIFTKQNMIFVNFPLDVDCLVLLEFRFVNEPLRLETHVDFHYSLVVYQASILRRAPLRTLVRRLYQPLIFG